MDDITRAWIRDASDERAAANGYRFDAPRGQFVVDWMASHLSLYEGEWAGSPFVCKDWQYDVTMRLFGWVKFSKRWNREVRRFREAFIMLGKKGGKSPTLASWALYLLCGDGEQGQKVFLAAKDGTQARGIAGRHAMEMVLASKRLKSQCTINRNLMSVSDEATRSLLLPLSSGDSRTKQSKEGLNGSVLVDETHVVDRDFMSRISRAGISRSEPLQIEVTTAGNDPDGYGHERFEYASGVRDGKIENDRFLSAIYAAPQDLADEDLAADPIKYGKMANPAWERLTDPEEYLADYEKSKDSIQKLADFKMYRLNIWQRSANPWLKQDDWRRCQQTFTEADLLGRPCGAGLDLGHTDDMTALALVFPEMDGKPMRDADASEDIPCKVLVWYWLPDAAVEKYGHLVPYQQWAADGWLRTIPSTTVEHSYLRHDIAEILKAYKVKAFAFDPWHAGQLIQDLQQMDGFPLKAFYEFRQSIKGYAGPCAQFERMVISGKLQHNGHPITTWQAGHVQAKADYNTNIRPVKPDNNDRKKIDGIVATVMGLDAAMRAAVRPTSVYDMREVRELTFS